MDQDFKWPAFTVQVPIFNTGKHLEPLLDALVSSGWAKHVREINFINDASTDDTVSEIRRLQNQHSLGSILNLVDLEKNIGRFMITVEGAKRASAEWILYLNSRSQPRAGFENAIARTINAGGTICAIVDVDVEASTFNLYWDRLHKIVFKEYMSAVQNRTQINDQNLERLLVGATSMVAKREVVLKAYKAIGSDDVLGDDTTFLREMYLVAPVFLDPEYRIFWTPRTELWPFLHHMYERGPNFVEYHIFLLKDRFLPIVLFCLTYLMAALVALFLNPPLAGLLIGAGFLCGILSTALMVRSPLEFIKLAPLHLATLLFFGVGVLKGFLLHSLKKLKVIQ